MLELRSKREMIIKVVFMLKRRLWGQENSTVKSPETENRAAH